MGYSFMLWWSLGLSITFFQICLNILCVRTILENKITFPQKILIAKYFTVVQHIFLQAAHPPSAVLSYKPFLHEKVSKNSPMKKVQLIFLGCFISQLALSLNEIVQTSFFFLLALAFPILCLTYLGSIHDVYIFFWIFQLFNVLYLAKKGIFLICSISIFVCVTL